MKYALLLVGGSLLTGACGDFPEGTEEALGTDQAPISGGRLVPSSGHGAPDTSVVKIERTTPFEISFCSAIKVASNVYWTAGHCMDGAAVGQTIRITNSLSGDLSDTSSTYTRTLASFQSHPSRKNYGHALVLGKNHRHYDVARFTLSATTPNIPVYSTTDPAWVAPNQTVTFTGYGCDAVADPGVPSWQGGSHSGRKQYDFFDLVDEPTFAAVYGQPPEVAEAYYVHHMATVGLPEGCKGDSGSPVWKKFGTTWKTVGIVVHGGTPDEINGFSGFTRYSNVRNWLASPAFNQFGEGFQGFILNKYTGRCLGVSQTGNSVIEDNCDGRLQDSDRQSWYMATAAGLPGRFLLVNGSTGKCLDLDTTNNESLLVTRTCLGTAFSTQSWRFDAASNSCNGTCVGDYRVLKNDNTGRCTAPWTPDSGVAGFVRSYPCATSAVVQAAHTQSWMMTR